MIDISYIVPVYNSLPYLEKTVASLIGQAYPAERVELIFVDDGSTDDSASYLDDVAATHPQVKVIHTPNSGGAGRPRNIGLDHATGEFVFFCDSDDWLDPQATARMLAHARDWDSDMLIVRVIGENGRSVAKGVYDLTRPQADPYSEICRSLGPWRLYRRSLIEGQHLRFVETWPLREDPPFVTQALLTARTVSVAVDLPYYHIVQRDNEEGLSSRTSRDRSSYQSVKEFLWKMTDVVEQYGDIDRAHEELLPRVLNEGLFDAGRKVSVMDVEKQGSCFRELWDRLAGYITDRGCLALGARRGMMLQAFKAGDLASWLELCTDDTIDLRFDDSACVFDDDARDAQLAWTSASGATYRLDAIGRYAGLGKSITSCTWDDVVLQIAGSFNARDLYGAESVSLVVQPRDLRDLAVEVPVAIGQGGDETHTVPWSAELPASYLRGLADDAEGRATPAGGAQGNVSRDEKSLVGFDTAGVKFWDFFIKGVYNNGFVCLKRVASHGNNSDGIARMPHPLTQEDGPDVVALYTTAYGNLSVRLLAHDPHLVVDRNRLLTSITLVITRPTLSKKDSVFNVTFERDGTERTVRLTTNAPKTITFKPLDSKGRPKWRPSVIFANGDATVLIPVEMRLC